MKFEELEIGGVYVFHYGKTPYIGKITEITDKVCFAHCIYDGTFQIRGSFRFNRDSTAEEHYYCSCSRKATQDEINQLNACIEKNTYVLFEDTVIVCEIW